MMSDKITLGKRIVVIGCGGAGKSFLSDQLGRLTSIEVTHLDRLFWLPGWVTRDRSEFDAMCEEIYQKDHFIIDGNYNRTMSRRVNEADTLIWLDFSTLACVRGVLSRVIKTHGQVRSDMGDGCPERFDVQFMKWIIDFRKNQRPKIIKIAKEAETCGKNVIVFKNRREVNRFIKTLEEQA